MLAEIMHGLAEMEFTDKDNNEFYPRPSSAGPMKCIRQMVYHGLKISKTPLPGRTYHVFDDGHWHEELILNWLRKSSFRIHSEQMKVETRPPMTFGHIDALFTDMLNIDRLLEIKGYNHFTFNRFWDGELPLDNLSQCAIYLDALQRNANPDLKQCVLLIKNKNTAQYIEFEVEYSLFEDALTVIRSTHSTGEVRKINQIMPEIVVSACDKFKRTLEFIDKKTLPKRQYHINEDWQCEYCQWCKVCWENYEQEFNELKTNIDLPNEIADTIRYYKELGAQKKDIESEYDDLNAKIKQIMKDAGAKQGKAGEYLVKISMIKNNRIDKDLLSPTEIDKATKQSFYERIFISKAKELLNGK